MNMAAFLVTLCLLAAVEPAYSAETSGSSIVGIWDLTDISRVYDGDGTPSTIRPDGIQNPLAYTFNNDNTGVQYYEGQETAIQWSTAGSILTGDILTGYTIYSTTGFYIYKTNCGTLQLFVEDRIVLGMTTYMLTFTKRDNEECWTDPRFTIMGNGTVRDNDSGLIWLRDARCRELTGLVPGWGDSVGWGYAMTAAGLLADGICSLSDGSSAGDWRLPTITEFTALVDTIYISPALSNTTETGHWTDGDPFYFVNRFNHYWSSTTLTTSAIDDPEGFAFWIGLDLGRTTWYSKGSSAMVWPVRSVPEPAMGWLSITALCSIAGLRRLSVLKAGTSRTH